MCARGGDLPDAPQAMDITKRHDAWIAQYCAQAEELKSLITQTAAAYSTTEYGNSTANIKIALDAFYEYKKDTKPQYQAILASMTGLHATLTASAKSNNRPPFRPAPGYSLADLAEDWKVRECLCVCSSACSRARADARTWPCVAQGWQGVCVGGAAPGSSINVCV
jgi:hypothetical protein